LAPERAATRREKEKKGEIRATNFSAARFIGKCKSRAMYGALN